jgi:hypothetical protein
MANNNAQAEETGGAEEGSRGAEEGSQGRGGGTDGTDGGVEEGVVVQCHTMHGYETHFRCILSRQELSRFKEALRLVSIHNNLDSLRRNSITSHVAQTQHSEMRRAVASAMDTFDARSLREKTLQRRGSMLLLPVLFHNDLVHGSWWLVVGSVLFVLTSVLVLLNSFDYFVFLGEDRNLNQSPYRATWVRMCVCDMFIKPTLWCMCVLNPLYGVCVY